MGLGKGNGDEVVDVSRKVAEAGLVAHEAVDVHQQKAASACSVIFNVGAQRLLGGRARILGRHGCKGRMRVSSARRSAVARW